MLNSLRHKTLAVAGKVSAALCAAVLLLPLSACVSSDSSDLDEYIKEVHSRKSSKIEPLPEIKVAELFVYDPTGRVDPFQALVQEEAEAQALAGTGGGLRPPENHVREELEYFPLDALRMVGTLEKDADVWGLVVGPDGTVHRVQPGNYVGRNYGKISLVAEDRVELTEVVPDGMGGWQERPAKLDLNE